MSKRTSIVKAIVDKINTEFVYPGNYNTEIFGNAHAKLKFWDEVRDFPSIYITPGSEEREYLPGGFKWGHLGVAIKVYCKGEESQEQLEKVLEDLEKLIDDNRVIVYDSVNNYETTEILIQSITTDEGLLYPYAIGEINLHVRYAIM